MARDDARPRKVSAIDIDEQNAIVEKRNISDKLPDVNNTDLIKRFFSGTIDNLFQPEATEKLSGYIGRIPSFANLNQDFYIKEPTREREEHQLEPVAVSVDSETLSITNMMSYDDIVNLIRFQGGIIDNHDRLFDTLSYSWSPPIDLDKLMNYTQYFWFPGGPDLIRFTDQTSIASFFGSSSTIIIQGIELQNGDRVIFENDIDFDLANRVFIVTGIGVSFNLLIDTESTTYAWDDLEDWDTAPWDGSDYEQSVISDSPDYIVMERGAIDGNAWSKRNRWYHRNELDVTQLDTALRHQALRPIIEFKKDLELYNHGTYGRRAVTVRDDFTTDPDLLIARQQNVVIDGISIRNGDRILFTNTPQLQGTWDTQSWDSSDDFPGWDPFFGILYKGPTGDIRLQNTTSIPGTGQGYIITSVGDFLNEGFSVGMKVVLQGTEIIGFPSNQDGVYTIESLTSTIMIFEEPFPTLIPLFGFIIHPYENNQIFVYQERDVYKNRVFEVSGIGTPGGIVLTLITDGQNSSGAPANGDQISVVLGLVHQGKEYYWDDLKDSWILSQKKERINQAPLFQLYDGEYTKLQDSGKYPLSTFIGNKIFSFQINENNTQSLDSILGIPLVYNEFGEITFENYMVTDRSSFNAPSEEIKGFYYHKNLRDITYNNDWYLKNEKSKQFLIERFYITDDDTDTIVLSVTPSDPNNIQIFQNGVERTDKRWVIEENVIDFFDFFEPKDFIWVRYYSIETPSPSSGAIYEIPSNLEANPNNSEITYIANSNYFSHFTSIIKNQDGLIGSPNGTNNYRLTSKDLSVGEDVLQHTAPMLKLMILGSSVNLDYMRSVRFVEREYSRFRNKFIRKLDEFLRDGIHFPSQGTATWIEDILSSINLGKTDSFPFYNSYMGTRQNGEPTYIPSSPSRLGITKLYKPHKYTDLTLNEPLDVIQMHDGSILIAFGDFRDDVILELEDNIYKSIPNEYKNTQILDFNYEDFVDSKYRVGDYSISEFNRLLLPIIQRWAVKNGFNLSENNNYSPTDPFTWNYSAQGLPGNWRGIYKYYYDTDRPNTHPWEMFGFSEKPDWWDFHYGQAPYTSFNTQLWDDMRSGTIRGGNVTGQNLKYIRPDAPTPVDGQGNLKNPIELNLASMPTIIEAKKPWKIGDHGPVETVFRRSEYWAFTIAQISYLMKPARFIENCWNPKTHIYRYNNQNNKQYIDIETEDRSLLSESTVHGEKTETGDVYIADGLQQWISDYLVSNGRSITTYFGNVVRGTNVQLGHKIAGYINSTSMSAVADNFGLVPSEDIQTSFYTSPSIREEVYSGVIIERIDGGWRIIGYDILNPFFRVFEPIKTSRQFAVQTGTIRVLESSQYRTDRILEIPYGTKFTTQQEVYDFLIGYGKYLESRGWIFDEFVIKNNQNKDWKLSGKQFLFWTQGRWDIGSVITLSPFSKRVKFKSTYGMVQSIEQIVNGVYSILDKDGRSIQPEQTTVSRDEDIIIIEPNNLSSIYSLRLFLSEMEHVITFNNKTIFNDLIYDPLFKLRQSRFKLFVNRTSGWKGRLNSPGYLVTQSGLIPNFEKTTNDFRKYFEIESIVDTETIQNVARRTVGFQTRDYLDRLNLSEETQFQFYQGFIRQKGTNVVLDKLLRSNFIDDSNNTVKFYEEWALKLGDFGAVVDEIMIEFLLREQEWRSNPQLVVFTDTDIVADNLFDDTILLLPNDERWIRKPPLSGITSFPLRTASLEKRNENAAYIYRTDNQVSGYPLISEVTYRLLSIQDRNELFNNLRDTVGSTQLKFGDTVWIENIGKYYSIDDPTTPLIDEGDARSVFNYGFMVYRYTNTNLSFTIPVLGDSLKTLIVTNSDHGLVKNDIVMIDNTANTVPQFVGSYQIDIPKYHLNSSLLFEDFFENAPGETIIINGVEIVVDCNELFEVVDLINDANIANIVAYDNGDGRIRIVNLIGETINLEVSSTASVIGAANATYIPGNSIEVGNSITSIQGTVINPVVVSGHKISINGIVVTFSGTTLTSVVDSINNANIPFITASKVFSISGDVLVITTTETDITISNVLGTGLINLGLTAGSFNNLTTVNLHGGVSGIPNAVYLNGSVIYIRKPSDMIIHSITLSSGSNVASAVIDINRQNIPDIIAINDNGALRILTSQTELHFAETPLNPNNVGAFTSLGISAGTHPTFDIVEMIGTVDDAVRDFNIVATGAIINPTVTTGQTIVINGITVMITSGTTLGYVINDINKYTIPNTYASKDSSNRLVFVSSNTTIELNEGNGTALINLGFSPGVYNGLNSIRAVNQDNAVILSNREKTSMIIGGTRLVVRKKVGSAFNDLGFAEEPLTSRVLKNTLEKIGFIPGSYGSVATDMFTIEETIITVNSDSFVDATIGIWTESRFKTVGDRDNATINKIITTPIEWGVDEYTWIDDYELDFTNTADVMFWGVEVLKIIKYIGDGSTTDFAIPAEPARFVKVNGVDTSFTTPSSLTVRITPAPLVNQTIEIGYWDIAKSLDNVDRKQTRRVDVELFRENILYNRLTNINQARINIFDPAKGLYPEQLLNEIKYKIEYDPAKYNIGDSTLYDIDHEESWSNLHIGEVWWDVSKAVYENYESGSNRERKNKWGRLSLNGSITLWEWVKSPVPPLDWESYVTQNENQPDSNFDYKPSGKAYMADGEDPNPPYTVLTELNQYTGDEEIYYYFWVTYSETVPNVDTRNKSIAEIARSMINPTIVGIPWMAAISNDAILVSGIEMLLTDNDSVLQIPFNVTRKNNSVHTEWKLSRENDPSDVPTDRFWNKMRDSLVGYDYKLDPVPDPNIEESRKYGNAIRPRQSWFLNRENAGRVFIDKINSLFTNICIIDDRPEAIDSLKQKSAEPIFFPGYIETVLMNDVTTITDPIIVKDVSQLPQSGEIDLGGIIAFYNGIQNNTLLNTQFNEDGTSFSFRGAGTLVKVYIDRNIYNFDYHVSDNEERDALIDGDSANSTLKFSIGANDLDIELVSSNGFSREGGTIRIENEIITYDYINGNTLKIKDFTPSVEKIFGTRGADGSIAVSHGQGTKVRQIGYQVWVDGITETLGFWKVYKFNGMIPGSNELQWQELYSESFKVEDFWKQIDYFEIGYSLETKIDQTVDTIADRNNIIDIESGFIVKVIDDYGDGSNIWAIYEYTPSDEFNPWVRKGKNTGTIVFDVDLFYNDSYGNIDNISNLNGRDQALLSVINSLRNTILTDEEQNIIFYTMIHYVFSEQSIVDWVFKTTYMLGVGFNRSANQDPIFQNDKIDDLISFINESKPYHTKLRDFITNENFGIDRYITHVTDFDKPIDRETGTPIDPDNGDSVGSSQKDWFDNYLINPSVIRSIKTQILFDRVSCDTIFGWDPIFGWDSSANQDWDITSLDSGISDTSVERIIKYYNPQPLSNVDITLGEVDPLKNIVETKDLQSLISGCNFKGTILDSDAFIIDVNKIDTFYDGGQLQNGAPINDENIIVDGNLFIQPGIESNHPEELVLNSIGESVSICVNSEKIIAVKGDAPTGSIFIDGQNIFINGVSVVLTGSFIVDAVESINLAVKNAGSESPITNIRALLDNGNIIIVATAFDNVTAADLGITNTIVLSEGSGTALSDIGLTAGTYNEFNDSIDDNEKTIIAFRLFLNNLNAKKAQNIKPLVTTKLASELSNIATEIQLESTIGFPQSGSVLIGFIDTMNGIILYEDILYTSITATRLTGLVRSNPIYHPEDSIVVVLDPSTSEQIAQWNSYRIDGIIPSIPTGVGKTTLARDFKLGDVEIHLVDVAGLPKQAPNEQFLRIPGVIWINNERIEFYRRDGTILKHLRRGTMGTSSGIESKYDNSGNSISDYRDYGWDDVIYSIGTVVIDGSRKQETPGLYEWLPRHLGLQLSNDTFVDFLKDKPGKK